MQFKEVVVEIEHAAWTKVMRLIEKGVEIPNPYSVLIGDDVDIGLISADRVKILLGCAYHIPATVISGGCEIGR